MAATMLPSGDTMFGSDEDHPLSESDIWRDKGAQLNAAHLELVSTEEAFKAAYGRPYIPTHRTAEYSRIVKDVRIAEALMKAHRETYT
jgi:hypothetical protein